MKAIGYIAEGSCSQGVKARGTAFRGWGFMLRVLFGVAFLTVCLARESCAVEIEIAGKVYQATVENGAVVVKDKTGKAVALPPDAGIGLAVTSDGKGLQITGGVGTAVVRAKGGVAVTIGPGQAASFTPTADGLGTLIEAVTGTLSGTCTVGPAAPGKPVVTCKVEFKQGSAAVFGVGADGKSGHVTNTKGSITLVDGNGLRATLDGNDSLSLGAGQAPGSLVLKALAGDGIALVNPDGITATLRTGQTQAMAGTAVRAGPGKGASPTNGKHRAGGSPHT